MRYTQRGVFHLTCLLTKDGSQQLFFGGQFRLAFRCDLADQDILWPYLSANIDDAALVEVTQTFLTDVWNISRDLLRPELGITGIDLVLFNMDRGEEVFTHNTLTDENSIFVVATLPTHEGNEDVLAERQFTQLGR